MEPPHAEHGSPWGRIRARVASVKTVGPPHASVPYRLQMLDSAAHMVSVPGHICLLRLNVQASTGRLQALVYEHAGGGFRTWTFEQCSVYDEPHVPIEHVRVMGTGRDFAKVSTDRRWISTSLDQHYSALTLNNGNLYRRMGGTRTQVYCVTDSATATDVVEHRAFRLPVSAAWDNTLELEEEEDLYPPVQPPS